MCLREFWNRTTATSLTPMLLFSATNTDRNSCLALCFGWVTVWYVLLDFLVVAWQNAIGIINSAWCTMVTRLIPMLAVKRLVGITPEVNLKSVHSGFIKLRGAITNKKSRTYGTSDLSDLSNLSDLSESRICQRVWICEANLWGHGSPICEADLWGRESPICEADRTLLIIYCYWLNSAFHVIINLPLVIFRMALSGDKHTACTCWQSLKSRMD